MIQLIVGNKGKGKTKQLLDKVNEEIKNVSGNIVYVDKSTKHMYELNNRIRLINASDYIISTPDEFKGFISGIIAADHDLEQIYVDSLLEIACQEGEQYFEILEKLDKLTDRYDIKLVATISRSEEEMPEHLKAKIIEAL